MAITLDQIKKLSPKAKVAIIVAAVILIGYFDWFYFLSATMEKKTSLKTKLEELQTQINEKKTRGNLTNIKPMLQRSKKITA